MNKNKVNLDVFEMFWHTLFKKIQLFITEKKKKKNDDFSLKKSKPNLTWSVNLSRFLETKNHVKPWYDYFLCFAILANTSKFELNLLSDQYYHV